jgi:uncharacterized repeat protein (TIGR01451 family)
VQGESNNASAEKTTAIALCATDLTVPTVVATATNGQTTTVAGGASFKATATCPSGTTLLDGGMDVTIGAGSAQGVHVIGDYPSDSSGNPLTGSAGSWSTIAENGGGSVSSLSNEAFALCDTAAPPGAPTIGTASAGDASATVGFTPPSSNGGFTITGYTVTAADTTNAANGGQTATGAASPITVHGLTDGDTYTFTVTATNSQGTGPVSGLSNAVTPMASPTLSTVPSTGAVVGGAMTDSATLHGASSPTGTVTFNLYGPGTTCGSPAFTDSEPVSAGGATSAGYSPQAPGTYEWVATYNGDGANNTASSNCGDEAVTVGKASVSLSTSASSGGTLGVQVSDTATIAGGYQPGGSLTFALFGPSDMSCTSTPVFSSTVTVGGDGSYPSGSFQPAATGTYHWVASYSGDANNSGAAGTCGTSSENVTIVAPTGTDLSITKTAPSSVPAGGTITYTIVVHNAGPAQATGVTVTDALPPALTFGSASSICTQKKGTVTCKVGTLASGAGSTITITATAPTPGSISNTASVTGAQTDPNQANNQATATTTVQAAADLSITKTVTTKKAKAGSPLAYSITVTNSGPSAASGVTVTDVLPAGETFQSASSGCSGTTTITCTVATLANGAKAGFTITVLPTAGPHTNTATASATSPADPNTTNNSASVTTNVGGAKVIGKFRHLLRFLESLHGNLFGS